MSDKDDIKKLPNYAVGWYNMKANEPHNRQVKKEYHNMQDKWNNNVFHAVHLAQMIGTNTESNPRPKEQQDWMNKRAEEIKQGREEEASKQFEGHPAINRYTLTKTTPNEKRSKLIQNRKTLGLYTLGYRNGGTPGDKREKEILDRVTGSVKGGKPVSDPEKSVIKLGYKKDK